MANESAVTGPLSGQLGMVAAVAAAAAVRRALAREDGGFNIEAEVTKVSAEGVAAVAANSPGALTAMVQAIDARFAAPKNKVVNVSGATYSVQAGDGVLAVTRTQLGACSITVPAAVALLGETYVIWDYATMAGTNNITIAVEGCTINGDSAIGISTNHGKLTLRPAGDQFDPGMWLAY